MDGNGYGTRTHKNADKCLYTIKKKLYKILLITETQIGKFQSLYLFKSIHYKKYCFRVKKKNHLVWQSAKGIDDVLIYQSITLMGRKWEMTSKISQLLAIFLSWLLFYSHKSNEKKLSRFLDIQLFFINRAILTRSVEMFMDLVKTFLS